MGKNPEVEIVCERCGIITWRAPQARYCAECYKAIHRERDRIRNKHEADPINRLRTACIKSARKSQAAIVEANGAARAVGMSYGQGMAYLKIREELEFRKQRFKEENTRNDKQSINREYEP